MNTESQHTHYTDISEHDFGLHDEIRPMKSDIERITQERDQRNSENDRLRQFIARWQGVIAGGDDIKHLEGWAQDFYNEADAALTGE